MSQATVTQLDSRRTAFAVFAADIRTRNYKPADAEFVIFLHSKASWWPATATT